jgi:hypothetical protein
MAVAVKPSACGMRVHGGGREAERVDEELEREGHEAQDARHTGV